MHHKLAARNPLELLSFVPELVGFPPRRSLVLVVFSSGTTCGTYRIDLPTMCDDTERGRLATTLIGMLCRLRGADGVVPIVYSDERFDREGDTPRLPEGALLKVLCERARGAGFRVFDALCVAQDGWGSFVTGCPPFGHPLDELEGALSLRRLDPESLEVADDPSEQARLPRVGKDERERTRRALREVMSAGGLGRYDALAVDPVWFAELAERWDPDTVTPTQAALVAAVVSQAPARDAVLFTWGWGREYGERIAELNMRHTAGIPITDDDDLALALGGIGLSRPPSPSGTRHAVRLMRAVAARLPRAERAPLITMLAWFSWALGRSSVAAAYLHQARAIDAGYGLADLLDRMLECGMLPEWAFETGTRPAGAAAGSIVG